MDSKKCSQCGEIKPLDSFVLEPRAKSGRGASCRQCHRQRSIDQTERNGRKRFAMKPGERYNALVSVEKIKGTRWRFLCDCGNYYDVYNQNVKRGVAKSCGCLSPQENHGMCYTPEYRIYASMITRCENANSISYKLYGGRGIKVHPEWRKSFLAFYNYIGARPSPDHSLDRYPDKSGNYEPGNVRWATWKEQNRNRRDNVLISIDELTLCSAEWCEIFKVPVWELDKMVYRLSPGSRSENHQAAAAKLYCRQWENCQ